jgi:integrase
MSKYLSVFAKNIDAMLIYREALGYSGVKHSANLLNFDRHCVAQNLSSAALTEGVVWGWLNELTAQKRSGMNDKAATIRLFGKYLAAIGEEAYVLPDGMFAGKKPDKPYIFTDHELSVLFTAIDSLKTERPHDFMAVVAPTLFRLIYTCGLRPNEGRELKRDNINFDTGEILITKTKRHKERIVVMSDDMLELCHQYDTVVRSANDSAYFFPSPDGGTFTSNRISSTLNDCWHMANFEVKSLPGIRVYDLRHRFASAALIRWLDEGKDLNAMLPYLSAYMGHDKLSETAYYIQILPERLVKSTGIDWDAFDDMLPGVMEL